MGSFYTESSYNFGTNSAQFPDDRERYKGEVASGIKERSRAVQRRGRERYKENKGDGTAGDRKDDSLSPALPSPIRLRTDCGTFSLCVESFVRSDALRLSFYLP